MPVPVLIQSNSVFFPYLQPRPLCVHHKGGLDKSLRHGQDVFPRPLHRPAVNALGCVKSRVVHVAIGDEDHVDPGHPPVVAVHLEIGISRDQTGLENVLGERVPVWVRRCLRVPANKSTRERETFDGVSVFAVYVYSIPWLNIFWGGTIRT